MGVIVDTGVFILWERRGRSVESRLAEMDLPGYFNQLYHNDSRTLLASQQNHSIATAGADFGVTDYAYKVSETSAVPYTTPDIVIDQPKMEHAAVS